VARKGKANGSHLLMPWIEGGIAKGTTVHSDEYVVYKSLCNRGYSHTTVTHKALEYVRGNAHTNTIEGFWSQFKRSMRGAFHCIPLSICSFIWMSLVLGTIYGKMGRGWYLTG
ncbi:transposase, partial [Candidatus Saccharibacteria bacterium]|nr:transposase [Candidatus Saccharibacteria bacterium]